MNKTKTYKFQTCNLEKNVNINRTCVNSENSVRDVLNTVFSVVIVLRRGPYRHFLRSNWTQGGPAKISKETYSYLWFSRGGGLDPLSPQLKPQFCVIKSEALGLRWWSCWRWVIVYWWSHVCGGSVFGHVFVFRTLCLSCFAIILMRKKELVSLL